MSPLEALFAPMTAGPRDVPIGFDEIGNPIYRTVLGQTYSRGPQPVPPPAPPRERTETRLDGQGRAVHHRAPDPLPAGVTALNDLASMFVGGLTAPGRAARGEPVTLGDALGTALDYGALGAPMRAPAGALRMFAGRNARTADQAALARAEELLAAGAERDAIWRETGWFQGQDSAWRFEIDDSGSNLARGPRASNTLPGYGARMGSLPEMFDHEPIYAAYPELRSVDLFEADMGRSTAATFEGVPGNPSNPASITLSPIAPDPRSATLHEVQHGIQALEGFAPGARRVDIEPGSPEWSLYEEKLRELTDVISLEDFSRAAGYEGAEAARDFYTRYVLPTTRVTPSVEAEARRLTVREAYRRAPGEVEARNVETRRDMTPEERRAVPPWRTVD